MLNSQENQIFQYNGSAVTFQKSNGQVMVNATEMAKPFGKSATHWLRNQQAKEFINELAELRNCNSIDLVQVTHGDNGGTFMHEDIALEFARWLSPSFAIWCNDRIKELLTQGVTTITNDDEVIAKAMNVLQKRLESSKQQLQIIKAEKDYYKEEIKELEPKAKYTDEVLQSTSNYTFTQVAHDLGLRSVYTLTNILKENKLIFKQSGQWQPTAKVSEKGIFDTRTHKYVKSDNTIGTSMTTVITEQGRGFIHSLIKNRRA